MLDAIRKSEEAKRNAESALYIAQQTKTEWVEKQEEERKAKQQKEIEEAKEKKNEEKLRRSRHRFLVTTICTVIGLLITLFTGVIALIIL
ncbi:hypothetical protein [Geomicrobium sp. JCM 19039]|uniref:hypothetical protein n=1 Tax=Geomicrobium sp. JCM 19039 TaxID=1460636 RepID=UPI00045F2454|nr:hypothetical protein [Geomicrobium sp. JCM 19039]GAK12432.1 hypothetical protein JCM19039_2205 [Geomicrobium sp. JCM 19039]